MSELVASVQFRAGIGGEPIVTSSRGSAGFAFQATHWGARLSTPEVLAPGSPALHVDVGVGACAEIRSVPPLVASGASSLDLNVVVESDAMLTWRLAPGSAAGRCEHVSDATVQLAASGRLMWVDEIVVDQSGPGTWRSRLRVTRDGWPVACRDLALGPGSPLWASPAVLDSAAALSMVTVVDPGRALSGWRAQRAATAVAAGVALPLAAPGVQMMAWGEDLAACRRIMEELFSSGMPGWAEARWRMAGGLATAFEPVSF